MCHSTHKFEVWLPSVHSWGRFAWAQLKLFGYISVFIEGIFLKFHTWYSTHIHYNRCKSGCDRQKIKGTLQIEECTFFAVVRFPLEGFSWIFTFRTPRILSTKDERFVAIMQYLRALYLKSNVSRVYLRNFYEKSYLALSPYFLWVFFFCDRSIITGIVLEEQCFFSTISNFH